MDIQFVIKEPSTYRLLCGCVSVSLTCLCWKIRQEFYSKRSDDTASFISLTYIRKSKGPRIDSWGTPHEIFEMLEYLFLILTKNARSVKQLTVSSQKPIAFNFSISTLWLIVSNAFWRSISIIAVTRPLPNSFKIMSFKYERHKSVQCFVLKSDWHFYNMLYWSS